MGRFKSSLKFNPPPNTEQQSITSTPRLETNFLSKAMANDTDGKLHGVPSPLHITKQLIRGRGDRISRNFRHCSPESDTSDAVMDSPPEPPDRPLTIPK
jgi:hypothetical protein